MNNKNVKIIAIILAAVIAVSVFAVVMVSNCNPDNSGDSSSSISISDSSNSQTQNSSSSSSSNGGGQGSSDPDKYDNEEDALVFSSGEFDGVFNPFFSSSAYDSEIAGQTQISMLSADDYGNNVAFGKEHPVVTLDYNETMYDARGEVTQTGDADGTTVYQMVLKNNIKFSDGQPLTAHDVLFNMYVYLDPNYTGSSTMYSTDIVGLSNYQLQTMDDVSSAAQETLARTFDNLSKQRISAISAYVTEASNWQNVLSEYNRLCGEMGITDVYDEDGIKADIAETKAKWFEEITSDWNAASADLASMQTEYPFTETWHLYFHNEGLISRKLNTLGTAYLKDSNGKYIIDWQNYQPSDSFTKEQAINEVKVAYLGINSNNDKYVATILGSWMTATTMQTQFAAEAKEAYYEARMTGDGLAVKNIEGIKIKSASEFKGTKKYANEDYSQYEMLEITINGVDPKAKWNFAFSVAPMHYYSTPELAEAALQDTNYESHFGVEFCGVDFMTQIKRRNKVPMGAGIYKASTINDYVYDWSKDAESFEILANGFLRDNICYFIRNDYFVTTGGDTSEVYNAKIKHIQYKVVNSANTMIALQGGNIHFADPSATIENINIVNNHADLERVMLQTAGYGYIGINAKYVPNINIRRAIMSAMDITLVQNFYPGSLSEPIYRAYSKTSWVYNEFLDDGVEAWNPESLDGNINEQYYPYYKNEDGTPNKDLIKETIREYLLEGGCNFENGKWVDEDGNLLKYTFTVAGDTTEHPAYKTFLNARDILNEMGMEIEVLPDSRALYKLASGSIAIWAAAWSSTIDPDMYQVYHKNSKATSILNWGYKEMMTSGSKEEKDLIDQISALIDQGRETIVASERVGYYRQATDLVMELAVELPVYQRSDMYVYNKNVLDAETFKQNPTSFAGLLSEMWKVSFVQ